MRTSLIGLCSRRPTRRMILTAHRKGMIFPGPPYEDPRTFPLVIAGGIGSGTRRLAASVLGSPVAARRESPSHHTQGGSNPAWRVSAHRALHGSGWGGATSSERRRRRQRRRRWLVRSIRSDRPFDQCANSDGGRSRGVAPNCKCACQRHNSGTSDTQRPRLLVMSRSGVRFPVPAPTRKHGLIRQDAELAAMWPGRC
jgi:hypothetical protein